MTIHQDNLTSDCCTVPQATHRDDEYSDPSSCCSVPANENEASEALNEVRSHQTPPEVAALQSAGFRLLLEHGEPVTTQRLAREAGLSETEVNDILATHLQGHVELDDEGRLLGVAGLTVSPTPHQLTVGSKTRWTWCAIDAVGILAALEATGTIQSTDPGTGQEINIIFTDGQPDNDAVLFILGGYDGGSNVREDWCPLVNFFSTTHDAQTWVTENKLEGDIVSVSDITSDAAAMWEPVIGHTSSQVC